MGLDAQSKRLREETIETLRAEGRWEEFFLPLVESYVRSLQVAREALGRLLEHDKRTSLGWSAYGSQGQLVQHPDVKTMREARRDATDFAKELLLTPAARRRAAVEGAKPPSKFELG